MDFETYLTVDDFLGKKSVSFESYIDGCLKEIFMSAYSNDNFDSTYYDKKKRNELSCKYLVCHLNDDKYIAKLVYHIHTRRVFPFKTYRDVLSQIKRSKYLEDLKKEYGLNEVKVMIWHILLEETWHMSDNEGISSKCFPMYKNMEFRKTVFDTFKEMGMDEKLIEEAIEKYSDLWLEQALNNSFSCIYNPAFKNITWKSKIKEYPPINEKFKKAWIVVKKYEYYKEHKKSVDLYGTVLPEMLISEDEYNTLLEYVNKMSYKRLMEIKRIDAINNGENTKIEKGITFSKKRKLIFKKQGEKKLWKMEY